MLDEVRHDPNALLAEFAVRDNILSPQQSEEALASWQQEANGKDFGMFLVARNYLSPETLWELVKTRKRFLDGQRKAMRPAPANGDAALVPNHMNGRASNGRPTTPQEKTSPPVHSHRKAAQQNGSARQVDVPSAHSQPDRDLIELDTETTLENLLEQCLKLGASDLHLHSGAPLSARLHGEIHPLSHEPLKSEDAQRLVQGVLTDVQRDALDQNLQLDWAFEIPGIGRFRANAYRQQRGFDAVFRLLNAEPPNLEALNMPDALERLAEFHQGLVLFTGPSGCGKSSTMAALVDRINLQRHDHILTIEDPVEYVHPSAQCNVTQREVGAQTESFERALRAALREDPDVIVIGELRDLETISMAITAAETGHLVLGTLHTSNAVRTVNRLLSVFPPEQQAQVRVMLSESLRAVVSQRLVQRADGKGRVPAVEVMFNNSAIGNLIRENRTHQIKSLLQTGGSQGQRLLDMSLKALVEDKVITREEAIRHAEEAGLFR